MFLCVQNAEKTRVFETFLLVLKHI